MTQQKNIPISHRSLSGPVACVHEHVARRNIDRMVETANASGVRFRPHFKTHQSAVVGEWFREAGVRSCAVSSPGMAEFFASHGWDDVLIAIPYQQGAYEVCQKLARTIRLGITCDSLETLEALGREIEEPMDIWLEIDAGYGRTGLPWDCADTVAFAKHAEWISKLDFRGVLCHAGDSYQCRSENEILSLLAQVTDRLQSVRDVIESDLGRKIETSFGDTPTTSVGRDFSSFDELRPGNFVFYDVMQYEIGSCGWSDIALTVACPVLGIYPDRSQLVIHGGAVHFSKERSASGHYGQVVLIGEGNEIEPVPGATLVSLSQEHGVIEAPRDWLMARRVGEVLHLAPVHSCLTVDSLRNDFGYPCIC